jgi:adenosylcobinamide kinase/adenosylcobinamide-phosphate guanylyltransferase
MPDTLKVARSELLLGSDEAAKHAHARRLAQAWIQADPCHRVVVVRTAHAGASSRDTREQQVTMEEPTELAHALGANSRADTLIIVDCLTLWLTASMVRAMLPDASDAYMAAGAPTRVVPLADAVRACAGPLVLVSDQGPGDGAGRGSSDHQQLQRTLAQLQQEAVAACARVTLVSATQVMTLKDAT